MNILFQYSKVVVPNKYNVMGGDWQVYGKQEIVVRHYAGLIKPWFESASEQDKAFWGKYKVDRI